MKGTPDMEAVDAIVGRKWSQGGGDEAGGLLFFRQAPPKSLDRNQLRAMVRSHLPALTPGGSDFDSELADRCATLAALTARGVGLGLEHLPARPLCVVVAGGGRKHGAVMRGIRREAQAHGARVLTAEEAGWDGDQLEAQCFAWLAVRRIRGLPTSLPCTTGTSQPTCGGEVVVASREE